MTEKEGFDAPNSWFLKGLQHIRKHTHTQLFTFTRSWESWFKLNIPKKKNLIERWVCITGIYAYDWQ